LLSSLVPGMNGEAMKERCRCPNWFAFHINLLYDFNLGYCNLFHIIWVDWCYISLIDFIVFLIDWCCIGLIDLINVCIILIYWCIILISVYVISMDWCYMSLIEFMVC
jgi:hypothetical protein